MQAVREAFPDGIAWVGLVSLHKNDLGVCVCECLILTESEAECAGTAEASVFAAYEAAFAARIGRKFA